MKKPLAILLIFFSFLSAQTDWREKEVHKLSWNGTDWLNNEKTTFDYSEDGSKVKQNAIVIKQLQGVESETYDKNILTAIYNDLDVNN